LVSALEASGELHDVPTILVTHHLEELPTTVTHAALLREGRLLAAGPVEEVLTDPNLSRCYDLSLAVRRAEGRWTATASR
jgi:iron complex transport system ATP-binding protein